MNITYVALSVRDAPVAIMQFIASKTRKPNAENIKDTIVQTGLDVVDWRVIAPADIPTDRTFRDAWVDNGGRIEPDMGMAREIARERIRVARAPKLGALDAAFVRALETGDSSRQAKVAEAKRRLRDAPADPRIDAAADATALKEAIAAIIAEMGN